MFTCGARLRSNFNVSNVPDVYVTRAFGMRLVSNQKQTRCTSPMPDRCQFMKS
jgi:hypothetical protein